MLFSLLTVVEERRGHFKAKNANSWETIRPPSPTYVRTPSPEPVDEDPYVVSTTVDLTPSVPPPAPARGGLQSASALRAEQERRAIEQEAKKAQAARELAIRKQELRDRGEDDDELEDPTATVYRDASGKKIDMKLAKAEKAKMERDRVEKEMQKMEWGKGLVQKGEKEERKKEAERLAQKGIARCVSPSCDVKGAMGADVSFVLYRYADDEDMNDELKDQERWNDPAAAFLTVRHRFPAFPLLYAPADTPFHVHRRKRRSRPPDLVSPSTLVLRPHQTASGSLQATAGTESTECVAAPPRYTDTWLTR